MKQREKLSQTINLSLSEWLNTAGEKTVPLPPVKTVQKPKDYQKEFLKTFQRLSSNGHHSLEIWKDFVLMAAIVMGNITKQVEDQGYITINDPCCGGGATLIAGVQEAKHQLEKVNLNYQNHVLVVAQDIDETVALMCYIQLSLMGVAGYVKVGNSLTSPIATDDSTENYWFTPMYFANVWTTRRMLQNTRLNEQISKIA